MVWNVSKGVVSARQEKIKVTAFVAVFLLALSSLASALVPFVRPAEATPADHVVINEVVANPSSGHEWVELYNPTSSPVDMSDWRIRHDSAPGNFGGVFPVGTSIPAHGFYVQEDDGQLPNDGATTKLFISSAAATADTPLDTLTYTSLDSGQSYGLTVDGDPSTEQVFASPTKGVSNIPASIISSLNAEEFATTDGSYKGISVGFNAKDFSNVSAVTVDMLRADGSHAVKHGTPDLFNLIDANASPHQFTAPFVIQAGSYDPAGDSYWTSDATSWSAATVPTSVTITITDENGSKSVTNSNFSAGSPSWPTYESLLPANPVPACSLSDTSFDTFTLGSVNGQHGWSVTNPNFDQAVVNNTYGYASLGCKSLRLSNAYTTGSFGDQTFSYSTANEAGEIDSTNGGKSGGTRQNHYEAQFDIASTQTSQQPGLAISVSPDRGDGSRMSYLRFEDKTAGVEVYFDDVQGNSNPANFTETKIATLSRTESHTIKFDIEYEDGPSNDVVKVYIDGSLAHTGTTWENYYRYDGEASAEQTPRTTDSLLFRSAGTAAPANDGKGFLLDNVNIATSQSDTTPPAVPTLLSPGNNVPVQGENLVNDWQNVADADYYVYQSYNVDSSGNCNLSDIRWTQNYTASHTNSRNVNDLTFCWRVKAVDAAGNQSGWSQTWKTIVDNTVPVITVKPGSIGSVSSKIFSKVSFKLHDNYKVDKVSINGVVKDLSNNAWSDLNDVKPGKFGAVEGSNTIALYDVAGNLVAYEFTLDTTAPLVSITNPGNGVVSGSVEVKASISDDNADHYYLQIENSTGQVVYSHVYYGAPQTFTDKTIYTWNTNSVSDGVYKIYLEARDVVGNKDGSRSTPGDSVAVKTVTVDNTAPVVTIVSETRHSDGAYTISGTTDDSANVAVSIDGTPLASAAPVGGNWTVTTPVLASGLHTVTAVSTDAAGNTTTPGATDDFITPASTATNSGRGLFNAAAITGAGNPAPSILTNLATVFGGGITANTNTGTPATNNQAVLGEQTDKNNNHFGSTNGKALGDSTDNNKTCNKFLGLCWYYWIPIVVVVIGLVYYIFRRRNQAQAG